VCGRTVEAQPKLPTPFLETEPAVELVHRPSLVPTGRDQLVAAAVARLPDHATDQGDAEASAALAFSDEHVLQEPEPTPRMEVILAKVEVRSGDLAACTLARVAE
jgi:hypothetical protein